MRGEESDLEDGKSIKRRQRVSSTHFGFPLKAAKQSELFELCRLKSAIVESDNPYLSTTFFLA
jgi:hypothetical protein